MKPASSSRFRSLFPLLAVTGVTLTLIAVFVIAGVMLFLRGQTIMQDQLKEKLHSIAAASAMQFDGDTLDRIRTGDTLDSSQDLRRTVRKLQTLRSSIPNVRYAYIMRRTDDPSVLEFVADADLLKTDAELDMNKNGVVDDDEIAAEPGEPYDWSEFPKLGTEAFLHPTVDDEVAEDQWGSIISGYAPIYRTNGEIAAVLGIDMAADDFVRLSRSIFSPIALLLMLLAIICVGTGTALLLWRRRTENIRKLDVERSGLLRLAFHQLGGPLTIIGWSLEELEDEGPASIKRSIVNIKEGVSRLSEILKMLRSADLVHSGKVEYKPEFGSLTEVIQNVVKSMGAKLAVKKQTVELDLESNITMNLDTKLITGVAEELLTNAIGYSPEGSVIRVVSRRQGENAEFSVIDRGCGIPKKDMPRIFQEFTRGSNATKYKADGNGLGLYIVRGVVTQAGGDVQVKSQEGSGTTVTVRLPLR